jgi:hypothetical protein
MWLIVVALLWCVALARPRAEFTGRGGSGSSTQRRFAGVRKQQLDTYQELLNTLPEPSRIAQSLFNLTRFPHVYGTPGSHKVIQVAVGYQHPNSQQALGGASHPAGLEELVRRHGRRDD